MRIEEVSLEELTFISGGQEADSGDHIGGGPRGNAKSVNSKLSAPVYVDSGDHIGDRPRG